MEHPQRFKWEHLKLTPKDVYDHRAFEPAVVMFLTTMSFGAILTLIPDYSKAIGIMNKGLFLSVTTVATVLIRIWAGKLSDRIGRLKACMIGTVFWVGSTLLLATLNADLFFVAAVLMGFATGMNSPAIFAWAVDVANGVRAGRAMATLFISLEIGIAIGSFLSAAIYQNDFQQLRNVFLVLSLINVVALLFLFVKNRSKAAAFQ